LSKLEISSIGICQGVDPTREEAQSNGEESARRYLDAAWNLVSPAVGVMERCGFRC